MLSPTALLDESDELRIAAISDLHVLPDNEDKELLESVKRRVEELDANVFVIAGDISSHLKVLSHSLAQLSVENCTNLYVAGNHDIWFEEDKQPSSLDKYSKLIGEVCKKNGFRHLPDGSFVLGSVGFVGSIGWYDYSFRRPELNIPIENYEQKEYRGAIWYDLLKIDWNYTDYEATELFNRKLEYDLSTLPNEVSKIIYISHHLPFPELTVYKNRLPWDFHSAFMGAKSTGEILKEDDRVVLSISGHSHVRNMISIDGLTAVNVPLGYCRPETANLDEFVKNAVALVEISEDSLDIKDFVTGDICTDLPYISSRY